MWLLADIGNTTVHVGLGSEGRILREDRFVPTERADLASFLDRFIRRARPSLEGIVVTSVRPATLEPFLAWTDGVGVKVHVAGGDLPIPLENDYRDPRQIGLDRLVDAHAVRQRLGGDWIFVNFGTAITVDAVSADGAFHSGAILPGLWLCLNAMTQRAEQLPAIDRIETAPFPTRSTEEAMVSGVLTGLAGMVDRIAEDLSGATGIPCRAVATGGDAKRIAPRSRTIQDTIPGLTFLGLLDLVESPA